MSLRVRAAKFSDLKAIVTLVDQKRAVYETYQPVFWRRAVGHSAKSRRYFALQILNPRTKVLVCERDGVVTGCLLGLWTPAPPVYAPGGPTITVDDFCVAEDGQWDEVGGALIDSLRAIGRDRGWHQIVAINAAADLPKARFLESIGLSIASTWWVGTF